MIWWLLWGSWSSCLELVLCRTFFAWGLDITFSRPFVLLLLGSSLRAGCQAARINYQQPAMS